MEFDKYKSLAMKTANSNLKLNEQIGNACLGLSGEVGEVNDLFKKYFYQGHTINLEDVKKELGDVLWYIALLCDVLGFSMNEVAEMNIKKLSKRYPNGFNTAKSIFRDEDTDYVKELLDFVLR